MMNCILVISATSGFGEVIRQNLIEAGSYDVHLAHHVSDALRLAKMIKFAVCILEMEVEPELLPGMIATLRQLSPSMRLVLIPIDNNRNAPEVRELTPDAFLDKPFYAPDLESTVAGVLKIRNNEQEKPKTAPRSTPAPAVTSNFPSWLQDVNRAAQHLTRLSLESSAQAALIVREQSLWAYAGQLSQPAAEELAEIIFNYWSQEAELPPGSQRGRKGDIARFTRLASNGGEFMVYATGLEGGMVLALAFDAQTPFSMIRAQASQLARALATEPNGSVLLPKLTQELHAKASQFPEPGTPKQAVEASAKFPPIEPGALLQDVPPAKPGLYPSKENSGLSSLEALLRQFPDLEEGDLWSGLEGVGQVEISQRSFSESPAKAVQEPAKIEFYPAHPAVYHLAYTCILIPRMPNHHLIGDLADQLPGWVAQLCLAFGWRLEHLSLRPEVLQWVVNIPPTTSPSYHMRIVRMRTSERIFASFPDIAQENPSNDFWAPGYLIMSGAQVPHSMIQEYIQQTRRQQGASSSYLPSQFRR